MPAEPIAPDHRGCSRGVADVLLLLNALFLAWLAGRLWRGRPLCDTLRRLDRYPVVTAAGTDLNAMRCAATRASRYIGRIGGLDSCVTRSLVLARLLRNWNSVTVVIGFRGRDAVGEPISGHAWVCVDGKNVSDPDPAAVSAVFTETHRLEPRDWR
jgi:hypothetical protein